MNAQITLPIVKEHLRTIEKAFGREWLESKKAGLNHSSKKAAHGVPRLWREISAVYKNALHSGELLCTPNLVDLITLGDRLSQTCALPNFDTCIQPRLRNPLDYESVLYEMQVASTMSSFGYTTSFTPVSRIPNEHTADIQIDFEGHTIYVECKKKDKYLPIEGSSSRSISTSNDLGAMLSNFIGSNRLKSKVSILSLGLIRDKDTSEIIETIHTLMKKTHPASLIDRKLGCVFKISDFPTPEDSLELFEIGVYSNGQYSSVGVEFCYNGSVYTYQNPHAVEIYQIDWYRLSQLIKSCKTAQRQLPENSAGIVYIDLDVSILAVKNKPLVQSDILLYLQLASEALKTLFSPSENTRICAVVLTAGPNYIAEGSLIISQTSTVVVQNPYASLPAGFIIPGDATH